MKNERDLGSAIESETDGVADHSDDLAVMRATLNGNHPAVEELIARLSVCVPRYLKAKNRRFGSPLDDAALCDLAQDVVTLVWRKRKDYEGRGRIESWACGIAALEMFNRVRRVRRESHPERADELAAVAAGPCEQPLLDPTDAIALRDAILQIPEMERRIICGKHYDGLSFSEIATTLKLSPNTTKTHYYRGIDRLRRMLGPTLGEDEA